VTDAERYQQDRQTWAENKRKLTERAETAERERDEYRSECARLSMAAANDQTRDDLADARMTAEIATAAVEKLRGDVARLREVATKLKDALDRDRTGLAQALNRIINEIRSRSWLLESRGAYEWDDDRYKEEAGLAMREAKNIADDALRASGKLADSGVKWALDELAKVST
jgi:chromosome segregation ATPase